MRLALTLVVATAGAFLLTSATPLPSQRASAPDGADISSIPIAPFLRPAIAMVPSPTQAPAPEQAALPQPPTRERVLRDGVFIVVSLGSQRVFVFRDGALWGSSKVSSGRRGHKTPTGVFPLLQKAVRHRSTIYSGAPMPYMQRLTWDGVALHAGHVPGYAASHGCIRLPLAFARNLYGVTKFSSTLVVVTDQPVNSAESARHVS